MRTTGVTCWLLWSAVTLSICLSRCEAEPTTGMGYYAILHKDWPCERSIRVLDGVKTLRVSYLANTFGNSRGCLNRILQDARPKAIQVHLFNQVCVRNRRCGDYEVLAGETLDTLRAKLKRHDRKLLGKIAEAANREAEALRPYLPNIQELYVSGLLEHDVGPLNKVVIDILRPIFPTAKIVDNPLRGPKVKGADIYEQHGEKPKIAGPTIVNLDGIDGLSIDLPRWVKEYTGRALIPFLWIYEFNGNCRGGGFVDPRKRRCWPSDGQLASLRTFLVNDPLPPVVERPKGCRSLLNPRDGDKRGFLWKQSDTHSGAVTLLPQPKRFKEVVVQKGDRVIEVLRYVYNYHEDGSNRQVWRAKKPAKDFPNNVTLRADSTCYQLDTPQWRVD